MRRASVRVLLACSALASILACGSDSQNAGDAGARARESGTPGSDGDTGSSSGGSGSGSSSGGSDSGAGPDGGAAAVFCIVTTHGVEACEGYPNLPADLVASTETTCANLKGTLATQCPTSNQVGCCEQPFAGATQVRCYYCGSASDLQAACTAQSDATWMSGSGGPTTCSDGGDGGD
jgi:hypothetical protein